ncbi:SCP-like protein [Ancylostoma ceylanicum]|uniref:SCP-like protein n=1 Tax=Ancylostoma ceylanicum TaxID=53326 RepID=A0A0D6LS28_9BILA|nr:SCP-like protein [Ancylostoma ceylanicum]
MLARGMQTNGKQFDLLPAATNMTQLAWSCQLELEAIKALENVCNTANPSRPNSGGKASIYVDKFQGVVSAEIFFAQNLREILSKVDTFVGFQFTRSGSVKINPIYRAEKGIKDYANVAWAATKNVGCSIVKCTTDDRYVSVCRYTPSGNIVGESIYKIGPYCSSNPGTTQSCDKNTGLWP